MTLHSRQPAAKTLLYQPPTSPRPTPSHRKPRFSPTAQPHALVLGLVCRFLLCLRATLPGGRCPAPRSNQALAGTLATASVPEARGGIAGASTPATDYRCMSEPVTLSTPTQPRFAAPSGPGGATKPTPATRTSASTNGRSRGSPAPGSRLSPNPRLGASTLAANGPADAEVSANPAALLDPRSCRPMTTPPEAPRGAPSAVEEEQALARFLLTPTGGSDEVAQRDLADRRPSANRDAEAVTGLRSPAATPWRSAFVTRFLAGLDEPRPRPPARRPEFVVLCRVAACLDRAARPRASPNAFHARDVHRAVAAPTPREKARPQWVSLGPERPSGTSDSIRRRGDDEDRFRGWPASRAARTHVLASNRPAPLGRNEPSVLTPSFPLHRCA